MMHEYNIGYSISLRFKSGLPSVENSENLGYPSMCKISLSVCCLMTCEFNLSDAESEDEINFYHIHAHFTTIGSTDGLMYVKIVRKHDRDSQFLSKVIQPINMHSCMWPWNITTVMKKSSSSVLKEHQTNLFHCEDQVDHDLFLGQEFVPYEQTVNQYLYTDDLQQRENVYWKCPESWNTGD
jgi:hypothetical protein